MIDPKLAATQIATDRKDQPVEDMQSAFRSLLAEMKISQTNRRTA
jgi:hypothetical protein